MDYYGFPQFNKALALDPNEVRGRHGRKRSDPQISQSRPDLEEDNERKDAKDAKTVGGEFVAVE